MTEPAPSDAPPPDPWDRWNEIALLDPAEVDAEHRALYAIGWLRTEINSGGFDVLFFNLGGNIVPDAVAALRQGGAPEAADLVERAMGVLGDEYPIDIDERQAIMEALTDADNDRLGAFDENYYDLESRLDFDALMAGVAPSG